MFAHILTNSDDEFFVKRQWEEFTGERLDNFSVSRIPLSVIAAIKDPDILFGINKALMVGRKNGQLLWIQEDVSLDEIHSPLQKVIANNTVHVAIAHF